MTDEHEKIEDGRQKMAEINLRRITNFGEFSFSPALIQRVEVEFDDTEADYETKNNMTQPEPLTKDGVL